MSLRVVTSTRQCSRSIAQPAPAPGTYLRPVNNRVCTLNTSRRVPGIVRAHAQVEQQDGHSTSFNGVAVELAGVAEEAVRMPAGVEEHFWDWTVPGTTLQSRIRYFRAGTQGPPLMLLHGFGVGAYHYERNIVELSKSCQVYAVDILGQGSSWPVRPVTPEDALYISIDTWILQLRDFATEVIKVGGSNGAGAADGIAAGGGGAGGAYVAGNSLGGLLGVYLSAMHPGLVKGLVLLNATPFWSFRPALEAPKQGFWGLMPPGFGSVPVPQGLKNVIERAWWNNLRSPSTVRSMLQLVYSHPASVDEETVERILEATRQPLALDVFSAIALAPKPALEFDESLQRIQAPVLMLYGREDPWVVPLWGQRLKKKVPSAIYLEMTPAGHCPHHEVPSTVNWAMTSWIASGHQAPVPEGESREVQEEGGRTVKVRNLGAKPGASPSNLLSDLIDFLERTFMGKA